MNVRLNVGCGADVLHGWVNVDNGTVTAPGVQRWDLDVHPWPWASESVGEVRAIDVYEHIDDPLGFMRELWRVCEEGAPVRLRTTYWRSENAFTDPTHKRFLTEKSFDYWRPGSDAHARYGAEYSGGRHFRVDQVWLDGAELEWRLTRAGACEGSCRG